MMSTTVLLNPPGKETYLRDYYCSKISQADYLNAPIDLIALSGWLATLGPVHLVDAIVDGLSVEDCLEQVMRAEPDIVVGLVASVSWEEDRGFYRKLRRNFGGKIVLTGDVLQEDPGRRLEELPFADALIHDFAAGQDVVDFLRGATAREPAGLTLRTGSARADTQPNRRPTVYQQPVPLHPLFLAKNYRYPFVRSRRFATVLTDFGCPYPCEFCVMSTLGWKTRSLESVFRELDLLQSLQVEEIFFLDQTFGLNRARSVRLLKRMRERDYGFGWVCFTRPDSISKSLLAQMKAAGCHTLIMGLESGSEKILRASRKGYGKEEILRGFAMARDLGFRTVATVILGLPEEDRRTFDETLAFLGQVRPDFTSFNVAVPRFGTALRKRALALGLVDPRGLRMDQSGHPPTMPTLHLSRDEVLDFRNRAVRQFYFRPGYLWGRLKGLSVAAWRDGRVDLAETRNHLGQAWGLLRRQLG